MHRVYFTFIWGISNNRMTKVGVVFVTSSVFSFALFEIFRMTGFITNSYVGLVTYLAFPLLFLLGLFLIPLGWWLLAKRTKQTMRQLFRSRFSEDMLTIREGGSRLLRTVTILTLLNALILGVAGVRTLHFMDESHFCGTACHTVMSPEWATYQQSPHARVKCIECHVGEGVGALIDSKLNGMWQVISASLKLYDRPIPTPVHQLRPARETCEKCHWPEMFHGDRIVRHVSYEQDSVSTPRYTTLMLKVGSGLEEMDVGSHWHIARKNLIRYASVDDEREVMIWVEARQTDGSMRRFTNRRLKHSAGYEHEEARAMDCVDCHNRATHIYEEPERAVDERIRLKRMSRSIPYLKKTALDALLRSYPDKAMALELIEHEMRAIYQSRFPDMLATQSEELDEAIRAVLAIYERNIHPKMNIGWGVYPSHIGHIRRKGCFRCHTHDLVDDEGVPITMNCTLCHSILARNDEEPFRYLRPFDENDDQLEELEKHRYLHEEFWKSVRE